MPTTAPLKKFDAGPLTALVGRWLGKESSCIGLDVGSFSVKGVLLQKKRTGLVVEQWALREIPPGGEAAARTKAVQEILQSIGSTHRPIVSTVGGPGTVLRSVTVPKMTAEELKTSLHFEAEKYIPFKLEEVFLDSAILRDLQGGRMEIFIAAARKDVVQGHLDLLASANVHPQTVDLEPIALANAWEFYPPPELAQGPAGLIHAGARGTVLNFFSGKELQFTREIPLGGDGLTRVLCDGLRIDAAEAERIKCQPGDRAVEVQTILRPMLDDWSGQCRASLDFYENQYGRRVERLFVSGGSALLTGFAEGLEQSLGLPVRTWNPLGPGVAAGPRLAVALGLALRGTAA